MAREHKEKFKTMSGGQALIEGIMMRGPKEDAIVVRTKDELKIEVTPRKLPPKKSVLNWPFIRGPVNFFDAQVTGVKAIMKSTDLNPEMDPQEEMSKFDKWLEKKLDNEKFQKALIGFTVAFSLVFMVALFFLLPMIIGSLFSGLINNVLVQNLIEGLIRIILIVAYMYFASRMKEMKRVFAYHGAEHKTISCYEAGMELTVENVRTCSRFHPRCGTSFLIVVACISILLFSVASTLLLNWVPALAAIQDSFGGKLIMILIKLALLPVVVSISYEINRLVGRHDNWFPRILTAPGILMQRITTNEPDDSMIEVGIAAVKAVLPEEEGLDRW